jgi:hypothetical protein
MNQILVTATFLPNRENGMTLEAFAQAHNLLPRWLELRRQCEDMVRQPDFWYRTDLRQQASALAIQASDILDSTLIETARAEASPNVK